MTAAAIVTSCDGEGENGKSGVDGVQREMAEPEGRVDEREGMLLLSTGGKDDKF
jgi:hypothetical protein